MSWSNGTNLIKPLHHDPKRLAREFLRLRGVSYKDLITGDHAADIFIEFHKAITDWNINVENMLAKYVNSLPPKPLYIKKEDLDLNAKP